MPTIHASLGSIRERRLAARWCFMKPGPYGPFPNSPIIRHRVLSGPKAHVSHCGSSLTLNFFSLNASRWTRSRQNPRYPDLGHSRLWQPGRVFRYNGSSRSLWNSRNRRAEQQYLSPPSEIIEEGEKRRWEWMGHNQSNSIRLNEVRPKKKPKIIHDTLDTIARASGKRPRRLAGCGTAGDLEHARSAGGRRLRICRRLGPQRRSALNNDSRGRQENRVIAVQL